MEKESYNANSREILGASIAVHKEMGPGLLESVYQQCLVKAVEILLPVHDAQIISYLKLANMRLGFLINFNVPLLKDGFKRFVNNF